MMGTLAVKGLIQNSMTDSREQLVSCSVMKRKQNQTIEMRSDITLHIEAISKCHYRSIPTKLPCTATMANAFIELLLLLSVHFIFSLNNLPVYLLPSPRIN